MLGHKIRLRSAIRGFVALAGGTALSRLDLKLMGLVELLIIVLVLAAIFGGVAVNPLLFVLLIVVIFILFTRGGFGYRRGGRL